MGRVSKRGNSLRKTADIQTELNMEKKRYKAGIYARLSSDQDEKKNESVEVQIGIARKFLEAGNYIEKIFPFLGVRFIAVADGFDTGKEGNENKQMASEIKNLVNDMYAKDFSKKAKLHLKQRREEGSYVGGPPPYGYMAEWDGKRRVLIPDENTEGIVRFIYEKFVETESYTAVADELNHRQINPPALYKKTKEVYHAPDAGANKGWDKSAVERILKSETYTGTLVQGRTSITLFN